MAKVLTAFVLSFLIGLNIAAAGTYDLVYRNVWPVGDAPISASPLIGTDGELDGFVYCDTSAQRIVIDRWSDDPIVLPQSLSPVAAVAHTEDADSAISVYVLLCEDDEHALEIRRYRVDRREAELVAAIQIDTPEQMASSVRAGRLSIVKPGNAARGIQAEVEYETASGGVQTLSIVLSTDLRRELQSKDASRMAVGDLVDDGGLETVLVVGAGAAGRASATVAALTDDDRVILSRSGEDVVVGTVLVGDFLPWIPKDELIISGDMEDLAGLYPGPRPHIGSYDLTGGVPREIWYREMAVGRFTFIAGDRHHIAGLFEGQSLVVLDTWSGEVIDSVEIDRRLDRWTIFETAYSRPRVHVAGFAADTLVVYSFSPVPGARASSVPVQPELPPTFELHQNYPNPFNGTTQLRFTNMEPQRLSLKIFNVLGQEIIGLVESVFAEGEFEYHWDGTDELGDPQASGIYFAQLRSGTQSQIIKLIYLK
ncbi:MAG: T9SS type A sorting domain-containing protein [candidate division Zixibacteria bacterium]|jgi:hypothetical protein|nr:T9SS type A sorting domain-containing protein [candidate division Zixibacteria bacterium]